MTTTRMKILTIFLITVFLGNINLVSQTFNNIDNGFYKSSNSGMLRMLGTSDANGNISGIGAGNGSNPAAKLNDRIGGTVEWAKKANQTVQGLYYTNLRISGNATSIKTIATNIFVSGSYHYNNTDDFSLNQIVYDGANHIFTYDGTEKQTILGTGDNTNNQYANLILTGASSIKNINSLNNVANLYIGGDVVVNRKIETNAVDKIDSLVIKGLSSLSHAKLTLRNTEQSVFNWNTRLAGESQETTGILSLEGSANTNLQGNIYNELGTLNIGENSRLNAESTSNITFNDNFAKLIMNQNSYLQLLSGAEIHNNSIERTNMSFNASTSPATIEYNAGEIMPTVDVNFDQVSQMGNAYGRVIINGSATLPNGDIYIAGNVDNALTINNNITVNTKKGSVAGTSTNREDYNRIIFTRNPITSYANNINNSEIIGIVARNTWNNTTNYRFNNNETGMQFANASPIDNREMVGFFVVPEILPSKIGDWTESATLPNVNDNDREILHRLIELVIENDNRIQSSTIFNIVENSLQVKYTDNDRTYFPTYPSTKPIRIFEGYGNTSNEPPMALTRYINEEQINGYYVAKLNSITSIGGISFSTNNNDIAEASQIIIAQNIATKVTSVRNGRWSDPETWDAGSQPMLADTAVIKHSIWTGDGLGYITGTNSRVWDRAEHDLLGSENGLTKLVAVTRLENDGVLFIGNSRGSGADNINATSGINNSIYDFGIIINENTNPSTNLGDMNELSSTGTDLTGFQGIYITKGSELNNIFRAINVSNSGNIVNYGILEVGKEN